MRGVPHLYCTTNVTAVLRVAPPDVAFIVTVYVPAGVPVVVDEFSLLEPHPACSTIAPRVQTMNRPASQRLLRVAPAPIKAKPDTGNQKA